MPLSAFGEVRKLFEVYIRSSTNFSDNFGDFITVDDVQKKAFGSKMRQTLSQAGPSVRQL